MCCGRHLSFKWFPPWCALQFWEGCCRWSSGAAENAGNLHSYCPQELRTPTTHQSSERTPICAGKTQNLREPIATSDKSDQHRYFEWKLPNTEKPSLKVFWALALHGDIPMSNNAVLGPHLKPTLWCSALCSGVWCKGAVALVYRAGLGGGREEMCLSSDWHSGNRHS